MTTFRKTSPSFDLQAEREKFEAEKELFRARTQRAIHSLLLKQFNSYNGDMPAKKSRLADVMDIDRAIVTKRLAMPGNLRLDTISDFLLAMGARLDPRVVSSHSSVMNNFLHHDSSLGQPPMPDGPKKNTEATSGALIVKVVTPSTPTLKPKISVAAK